MMYANPGRTLAALALLAAITPVCPAADPLSPEAIRERIQKYRTAQVTLRVLGPDGKPLANQPVTVGQVSHKFLFGSNAFALNPADRGKLQQGYQRRFTNLLNFATLGFYWGAFEYRPGALQTDERLAQARWLAARGVRIKGHPLLWRQVTPAWLPKDLDKTERLQLGRIRREVKAFAGLVGAWDVVNEAASWNEPGVRKQFDNPLTHLSEKVGVVELLRRAFRAARETDPRAILLLNDYVTSDEYVRLIDRCLKAGVPIDVIGIQSHMHGGYWGARQTWETAERFARFGKPLHFTEVTILSGEVRRRLDYNRYYTDWPSTPRGEREQARQVAEFYTVLFSHPKVEAITWWDFSDYHAWLGAPAGLVRKDMSPKPAYEALLRLVKQDWWTAEQKLVTDAVGRVRFRGFLGGYRVKAAGGTKTFALDKPGALTLEVRLAP